MSAPRRVRVTSPQTRIALSRRYHPAQHLLPPPAHDTFGAEAHDTFGAEAQARAAAARVRFARQRRLAVRTLCALGGVLFGLSGLVAALPVLDQVRVAEKPVSWLLMGVSYPLLFVVAAGHVRAAERIERDHDEQVP